MEDYSVPIESSNKLKIQLVVFSVTHRVVVVILLVKKSECYMMQF